VIGWLLTTLRAPAFSLKMKNEVKKLVKLMKKSRDTYYKMTTITVVKVL
jgi:hypothetical protein